MVCEHCGGKTHTINSRLRRRTNQVWRRRQCQDCQAIFSTQEATILEQLWRVRAADKAIKAFSRDKLLLSLYNSCAHRSGALQDAAGLTDTVIAKLRARGDSADFIDTATISNVALVVLTRFDKAAATHYKAFHPN